MSSPPVKCKKCHCVISEEGSDDEDGGGLCDNCNVGLIAQNLAAELCQQGIIKRPHAIPPEDVVASDEAVVLDEEAVAADETVTTDEADTTVPVETHVISSESEEEEDSPINDLTREKTPEVQMKVDAVEDNKMEEDVVEDNTVDEEAVEDNGGGGGRTRKERDSSNKNQQKSNRSGGECEDENVESKRWSGARVEPVRTRAKVQQSNSDRAPPQQVCEGGEETCGEEEDEDAKGPSMRRLTRKALSDLDKYRHPQYEPAVGHKSRRTKTFKAKPVYKAPTSQARIYASDYVFHKGRYFQMGDVVLLRDTKRTGEFFAQITSFLTDQYCHKCATIQWLFPTKQSPSSGFDPATYFLGYLDEVPRPLDSLLPVMHLPSDYYRFNKTPYPSPSLDPLKKHYLWARLEPVSLE